MQLQFPQKLMDAVFPLPPLPSNTFGSPETMVSADLGKIAFVAYVDPDNLRQL